MPDSPQINKAYLLIALNLQFVTEKQALENTGLSLAGLTGSDTVDVSVAQTIVRNLNQYSVDPVWPTVLGAHLGVASHGPVGYAMMSAPSVSKALQTFTQWFEVRCQTYSGKVIEQDEYFDIVIGDTTGDAVFQAVFFEAFMRAFEVLITTLIGRAPKGETELHFQTQTTDRQDLMEKSYDSRLVFGTAQNKLSVPKSIWFLPSPLYDKDSYQFNLGKCQQLLEEQALSSRIDLRVRHIFQTHFEQMLVATSAIKAPPNQREICASIYRTERTLIRQLKLNHTSYKLLLAQEREKMATRLLKQARYTVYHIAEVLGYRETANFCRAFKQWTGQTPMGYRQS